MLQMCKLIQMSPQKSSCTHGPSSVCLTYYMVDSYNAMTVKQRAVSSCVQQDSWLPSWPVKTSWPVGSAGIEKLVAIQIRMWRRIDKLASWQTCSCQGLSNLKSDLELIKVKSIFILQASLCFSQISTDLSVVFLQLELQISTEVNKK